MYTVFPFVCRQANVPIRPKHDFEMNLCAFANMFPGFLDNTDYYLEHPDLVVKIADYVSLSFL